MVFCPRDLNPSHFLSTVLEHQSMIVWVLFVSFFFEYPCGQSQIRAAVTRVYFRHYRDGEDCRDQITRVQEARWQADWS